jgi:hypothetical protein
VTNLSLTSISFRLAKTEMTPFLPLDASTMDRQDSMQVPKIMLVIYCKQSIQGGHSLMRPYKTSYQQTVILVEMASKYRETRHTEGNQVATHALTLTCSASRKKKD